MESYYHKRINLSGYTYDLRIWPYNSTNKEKYYYDAFDLGFGNLDRWYKNTPNFNDGYSIGFWLEGYENNPLIIIGAKSITSYNYLRNIYHNIKP